MRAFTLIEFLIAVSILAVVTVGTVMFLNSADSVFITDAGLLDLRQQARRALNEMVREIRGATGKSIDVGGASITISTPSAGGVEFYRDTNDNQLIREFPSGTEQVLANDISALSFCCWHDATATCDTDCTGSNLVEIVLTASNAVRGRVLSFPLKGQANTRND